MIQFVWVEVSSTSEAAVSQIPLFMYMEAVETGGKSGERSIQLKHQFDGNVLPISTTLRLVLQGQLVCTS